MHVCTCTCCIHNLLAKTTSDLLPAAMKDRREPWDTAAMVANGSGFPVYRKIKLMGQIRSSPFSMEFLVSRISDEEIFGMAFLAGHKCTLYLDKGVVVW